MGTPIEKAPIGRAAAVATRRAAVVSHVDINLLTVIAHIEQLQFDIGTWVTWDLLTLRTLPLWDGDPDIINGLTANDRWHRIYRS